MIRKFNEMQLSDEQIEFWEEFEETEGFPIDFFLFAPYKSDTDGFQVVINPNSYWVNNKHCFDQSIDSIYIDMPSGFGEACESDFEYDGPLKEAIEKLVKNGFRFNKEFQSFIEKSSECYASLSIDGDTVSQYIIKNYPQIII